VEIALSLIIPYAAYLAGDAVRASGVIAVVACGLLVSRHSSRLFTPRVRLQAFAVWDALEFLLNGFVFVLIGLQLPYVLAGIRGYGKPALLAYAAAFSVVLVLLRLAWMFPAARAAWWVRTHVVHQRYEKPRPNQVFVVGWTGMRGVVALAAANTLPFTLSDGRPFPQRSFIIFLTFSLILVTLVFQGLSLPWLVRKLKLSAPDTGVCEEGRARHILLETAIGFLAERRDAARDERDRHLFDDLLHQYEHKITEIEQCGPDGTIPAEPSAGVTMAEVLLDTIRRERQQLNVLRETGRIGDAVHRTLERELDLSESKLA
jgi:NhaP-type Na+/H+ or K+/H+ antiporter